MSACRTLALAQIGVSGISGRQCCPKKSRSFATETLASWGVPSYKWWHVWNWDRARRVVRVIRVCGLSMTLYSAGYAAGMHNYATDPDGVRKRQSEEVLRSIGAVSNTGEIKLCTRDSEAVVAVQKVFPKILKAAREEVLIMERKLQNEIDVEDTWTRQDQKRSVQRAKAQLMKWRPDGFLVVDVNTPDAFVHALVPQVIFVHRGVFWEKHLVPFPMCGCSRGTKVAVRKGGEWVDAEIVEVKGNGNYSVIVGEGVPESISQDCIMLIVQKESIVQSDEQLAMLLAHELSHVIHDHADSSSYVVGVAAGCQLVFLALLDPTGLLSFVGEIGMAMISKYGIQLPFSRRHEMEADATGLKICARALYDPQEACKFFERKLAHEATGKGGPRFAWASTHPKTADRIVALHKAEVDAIICYQRAKEEAERIARRVT